MADGGNSGWPIASFFKLLLKPLLHRHKLVIPIKFMESHGNDISNVIYLHIPPGKVWKFNLVRDENGNTLLEDGWQEFVKFYSLDHGHLLVFKYQGNSHFNVIIFDTSATEIQYPQPQASPHKRKISPSLAKPASSSKKAKGEGMIMDGEKLIMANTNRGTGLITPTEKKRVRDYACHLKHPSFVTKMQASFIHKSCCYLGIPKEFAKRYLRKDKNLWFEKEYRIESDDNNDGKKVWKINIVGKNTHVRMIKGWGAFASQKRLKVGDICIFELLTQQHFDFGITQFDFGFPSSFYHINSNHGYYSCERAKGAKINLDVPKSPPSTDRS